MAHAQRKTFTPEQTHEPTNQGLAPEPPTTPLAFWADMAEMQKRFLSSLVATADQRTNAGASVADLRPNETAAPTIVSQNWLAAMTECQQELASFVQERLTKNRAFVTSASATPGLNELVTLQVGWMNEAAQDYVHELGRLSSILKNGADEVIATGA